MIAFNTIFYRVSQDRQLLAVIQEALEHLMDALGPFGQTALLNSGKEQ